MLRWGLLSGLTLLLLLPTASAAQINCYTVMSYNTENTFDTIPSADGHLDTEFLPQGSYHWTRYRYMRKLRHIMQVMMMADTVHPVDLALLQEVESDSVLHDLLHRTPLANVSYGYFMTHSQDPRGINVALVYGKMRFFPLGHDSIRCDISKSRTRDILHVYGTLGNVDTLDIYVLHLPSRLGAGQARHIRERLIEQLGEHIDSVVALRPRTHVVVGGDFNAGPSERALRRLARHEPQGAPRLTCLMDGRKGGSYKYRGRWEWIDQLWVSPNLLAPVSHLRLKDKSVRAAYAPRMLEDDATWGGQKPYRAFRGPAWTDGFSDHLPVVMTLQIEP